MDEGLFADITFIGRVAVEKAVNAVEEGIAIGCADAGAPMRRA